MCYIALIFYTSYISTTDIQNDSIYINSDYNRYIGIKEVHMIYYFLVISIMSTLTYMMYAADKKKSVNGEWRIKESTLLVSSVLFGAPGGLVAMYQLRHKTNHWYFVFINWLALIIQITVFVYFITM
jgi:uncharacterized membrane protein YsdA (DUF1294 family)